MIPFLAAAVALSLIALGFVLWPLLRANSSAWQSEAARRRINREIYRERLAVIEQDIASGRLEAPEAERQRNEAANRLLQDLGQNPGAGQEAARFRRHWLVAALTVVLLPGIALLVYLQSDSWMLIGSSAEKPAWNYMTKRMESRVAAEPQNPEALLMLARTRRAMEDLPGAIEVYEQLNAVTGYSVAEYLSDEAETRILAAQGEVSATARQRLQQALAVAPNDGRALWYSGLAALTQGDQAQAVQHWRQLATQDLPEAFRKVLVQQLERLGVAAAEIPAPARGPQLALKLQITAEPGLIDGLPGDTPVFVMARPADGGRAMLAVRKHRLDELPLETVLTDGMNMAGGPQLSDFTHWRLVARVAVDGEPLPDSGDPYAEAELQQAQSGKPFKLNIDRRWP